MALHPRLAPQQQMTIEEFLAFTDTRPDEERWELIEGVRRHLSLDAAGPRWS